MQLFELPYLEDEDKGLACDVDAAWKKYYQGEYSDAIVQCRKILERIEKWVRSEGYEKPVENSDKKAADWRGLFDNDTIGKNFEKIFRGTIGISYLSAHDGVILDKKTAEMVLLTTYSIANYLLRLDKKQKKESSI